MEPQRDIRPIARVFFVGGEDLYPGWYVQKYVDGQLTTIRLRVDEKADAYEAVTEATDLLACSSVQIQVEGEAWPTSD